jgi:hypothetical protein
VKLLGIVAAGAVLVAACAADNWSRLQAEFPEVRANCRLGGTTIERSRTDRRLVHLVFRQRNAEELAAARDGRLACAEHWARERGFRLTTEPQRPRR